MKINSYMIAGAAALAALAAYLSARGAKTAAAKAQTAATVTAGEAKADPVQAVAESIKGLLGSAGKAQYKGGREWISTVNPTITGTSEPWPESKVQAQQPTGGGFVIGGGGGSGNPSHTGSGYFGAGGTEINDAGAVQRFDSINGFINTLDWSPANKEASAAALADAANRYGVSQAEIAIASGYRLDDVADLLKNSQVARY